jgi:hypothetical protein
VKYVTLCGRWLRARFVAQNLTQAAVSSLVEPLLAGDGMPRRAAGETEKSSALHHQISQQDGNHFQASKVQDAP